MSDLSTIHAALEFDARPQIAAALARGLRAWGKPEPVSLELWAREHFYLSAESSYVEQHWTPWTFQRGILACLSCDDIREVDVKKSARVGYTKMLLALQLYTAHHKRRNQILWQPTDEDRDEYVKTELEPALRDVAVMRDVMPSVHSRSKDNTLHAKKFAGSVLHTKGGKAAKNYRRVSVDLAVWDEISAFDNDIEKEGDPFTLGAKRIEGATYSKAVVGSTPKEKGLCLIDARFAAAEVRMRFHVPCPHCGERHALTWGGKDEPHGFKFDRKDPTKPVLHFCPRCGQGYEQADYLRVESQGVWVDEDGALVLSVDERGEPVFTTPDGAPAPIPAHIAFHVWTAYSPAVAWSKLVKEFGEAYEALERGDDAKMKAFTNTTLGECWAGEIEHTDSEELKQRAEPFALRYMPMGCLLLLCGCDVQGNRIEAQVWGLGLGGEMWSIDHRVFFGNPEQAEVWDELEEFLFGETYNHAAGTVQSIFATQIDSGYATNAAYAFAHKHRARRVYATKGSSGVERSIENGNTKVGYDWRGRREKSGPTLWHIGTHLAKDRFAARLEVSQPGPGYVHLSSDNTDEWFRQLAAEDRVTVRTQFGVRYRWVPNRKRNEVIDMTGGCIWLEERLSLWTPRKKQWWADLEESVQPAIPDMFAAPAPEARSAPRVPATPTPPPAARPAAQPGGIAKSDWSSRL